MVRRRRGFWGVGLLGACLVFWASCAFGAPTTGEQALKAARNWAAAGARLGEKTSSGAGTVASYRDGKGQVLFHVVRLGAGTVILPGDDRVEPILAFLPEGSYDDRTDNPLRALVRRDLKGRFAVLTSGGASEKGTGEGNETKWRRLESGRQTEGGVGGVSDVRVAPLVASRWNQAEAYSGGPLCYNLYTPENLVCGCVATAMAQVMYTHRHPAAGVGTPSFPIRVNGVDQTRALRGGDGAGGPYDWDAMVAVPGPGITSASCQAIGALTHDAGVAAKMRYSSAESGTGTEDARDALVGAFGYGNAVMGFSGAYGTNVPGSVLRAMVNPNLDAGYPVLLGLTQTSDGSGHEIVCDGYGYEAGTGYHHLNLGWSGASDAWYNLPNIDAAIPFDVVDDLCYNIFVSGTGEIVSGRVLDGAGNPVAGATVTAAGGGRTFTDLTDSKGVFALPQVPSGVTYTLTSSAGGTRTVAVGVSQNGAASTGNVWNVLLGTAPDPSPTLTVTPLPTRRPSSGGGGCAALGFLPLLVLVALPLAALRRRG